jgi:hypothetical protein
VLGDLEVQQRTSTQYHLASHSVGCAALREKKHEIHLSRQRYPTRSTGRASSGTICQIVGTSPSEGCESIDASLREQLDRFGRTSVRNPRAFRDTAMLVEPS